jgi:hypothetical protein
MDKKVNIPVVAAGIIMLIVSGINFLMNNDYVSLGIFISFGTGFILYGIKNKYSENQSKRINKYALTFLAGGVIIFLIWLLQAKFELF